MYDNVFLHSFMKDLVKQIMKLRHLLQVEDGYIDFKHRFNLKLHVSQCLKMNHDPVFRTNSKNKCE